jgi:hypothetical protein
VAGRARADPADPDDRDAGILTETEFAAQRAKILNG